MKITYSFCFYVAGLGVLTEDCRSLRSAHRAATRAFAECELAQVALVAWWIVDSTGETIRFVDELGLDDFERHEEIVASRKLRDLLYAA